jgi:hypothetical protein
LTLKVHSAKEGVHPVQNREPVDVVPKSQLVGLDLMKPYLRLKVLLGKHKQEPVDDVNTIYSYPSRKFIRTQENDVGRTCHSPKTAEEWPINYGGQSSSNIDPGFVATLSAKVLLEPNLCEQTSCTSKEEYSGVLMQAGMCELSPCQNFAKRDLCASFEDEGSQHNETSSMQPFKNVEKNDYELVRSFSKTDQEDYGEGKTA